MTDLTDLLPSGPGWVLSVVTAINDLGQIVGSGSINGASHAFLLTPTVPVPAAVWLLGSGMAGVLGLVRRKPRRVG